MTKEKLVSQSSIYEVLAAIQSEASVIKKDSRGYGYNYASLNSVIELLHPLLVKNGCSIRHTIVVEDGLCECITSLSKNTNESISVSFPLIDWEKTLEGKKNPVQNMGGALSYARRYNLLNLFNLYAEDNDAEEDTRPASPPAPPKTKAIAKPVDLSKVSTLENIRLFKLKFGPAKGKEVGELSFDEAQHYVDILQKHNNDLREQKKDIPVDSVLALTACQGWIKHKLSASDAPSQDMTF